MQSPSVLWQLLSLLILGSYPAAGAVFRKSSPTAPVHSVLAHGRSVSRSQAGISSGTILNASRVNASSNASRVNASSNSSRANRTDVFRLADYPPAIGKVFAVYYSSISGQAVTSVQASNFQSLTEIPADSEHVWADGAILERGDCPLQINARVSPSDARKANLRLAELAVCAAYGGQPCGANSDGEALKCSVEVWAPLPTNSDEEAYLGASIAVVAHSLLCVQHVESYQTDQCKIARNSKAVSAGLQRTGGNSTAGNFQGVTLKPFPGAWVDLKMTNLYLLGFPETIAAEGNRGDYERDRKSVV